MTAHRDTLYTKGGMGNLSIPWESYVKVQNQVREDSFSSLISKMEERLVVVWLQPCPAEIDVSLGQVGVSCYFAASWWVI